MPPGFTQAYVPHPDGAIPTNTAPAAPMTGTHTPEPDGHEVAVLPRVPMKKVFLSRWGAAVSGAAALAGVGTRGLGTIPLSPYCLRESTNGRVGHRVAGPFGRKPGFGSGSS